MKYVADVSTYTSCQLVVKGTVIAIFLIFVFIKTNKKRLTNGVILVGLQIAIAASSYNTV